jgi:predicted Zn-dependent protease
MFRFVIPLTLALALSAQDQPLRPTGSGVNFFSLDNEIAMGAQLADAVRRDTKPLDNSAVQQYVTRLGQRLAAQAGGPNFTYTFTVVVALPASASGDPAREPLALPGGPIFIPADLILGARGEGEFAGMLAHAIAHVAGRHYTRQMTRQNLAQIGAIAMAGAAIQQSSQTAASQGDLQFRRTLDAQADRLAVQIMAKAGYDPAALVACISRMQLGTDAEQRISAVEDAIATLPARTYTTSSGDFDAIQRAVK